jgi:hypothetical protein
MFELDSYRHMSHNEILKEKIISIYEEVLSGTRKSLPHGTWEEKKNTILIYRYLFEIKLKLPFEEIPKITRKDIAKYKLWGSLTRYKSMKKIIQLVYPNKYNEFHFFRVPKEYWNNIENIKNRIEYLLQKEGYTISDIPSVITYQKLIKWGLANPLKRWNDSPFQLINAIYPNMFRPTDFRKSPQRSSFDKAFLIRQFYYMLEKEQIQFCDVPHKVTQELLIKYRFSAALKHFSNSPSELINSLFPDLFSQQDFKKKNKYWHDINNVKAAVKKLCNDKNIPFNQIPKYFTKKLFRENGLYGMLQVYNSSPIELVLKLYPGVFSVIDFKRVPNKFWFKKENRIQALRDYCAKMNISRDKLPKLTRPYFKKYFPRFISLVDRHYESKFYLWIIESFPEYQFNPDEFRLLIGDDGQVCDSFEELTIHNFLYSKLKGNYKIEREGIRFINELEKETYLPDWVITNNKEKYIIEYFGLYGSTRYSNYNKKVERKMVYYTTLKEYRFIPIMPSDFRKRGLVYVEELLEKEGLHSKTCEKGS